MMEDLFEGWLSMPTVTSFLEEEPRHGEDQLQENPTEKTGSDGGDTIKSYEIIVVFQGFRS
jgi:hypothetical protein